ncbi:dienelactone hydrolase family protein [Streptomyces sp. H10-C2]|uniref:dienelactone hydrolase family protein n=1 Tax=unclassified Streptomyces TaxID=2593676 RepID=UPI0024B973C9|nr:MULTISPECIES: dienelactone hydrolase family protein [unclassified Streptomyces]MDJ0341067.1 dienelactone hydrolase family protein [Streptomyces sp. PH10-H1]MDJ0369582.1 dienelactone hydrolase family protein [Streptomyces sp. H10-C2]
MDAYPTASEGSPVNIVMFHSAYGLRPAVRAAAELLRAAGHEVHIPDLYDGRTADSVEEGMRIKDGIGREELLQRAVAAAAPYSDQGLVYAGFSLGGSIAQTLALGDEKARGLLLLHGTSDIADDAATGIPVQLHVAEPDPFEPEDWLNAWYLRMRKAGADVEVHRYRGAGHLYTDPELHDYDAEAAERTWAVVLDFLADLDADR